VVVEENNLTQAISTLRGVFNETRGQHRFIVTEPGRGYRFVARVDVVSAPPAFSASSADLSPAAARPAAPTALAVDRPTTKPGRRPSIVAAGMLVALVVLATTAWVWQRAAGVRWARQEAIPQVAELVDAGDFEAAFALANQAKQRLSFDPLLDRLTPQ